MLGDHSQIDYSLPPQYDDARIVLLARDPHWLYAYWDLSDDRKDQLIQDIGNELWQNSTPVLKINNLTKNNSFYVRINDFSNSWYIHVEDSNCLYTAEIGRKIQDRFFLNIADSNCAVTPSNNAADNSNVSFVNYKDLKNGKISIEDGKALQDHPAYIPSEVSFGISSPEVLSNKIKEELLGVSSATFSSHNLSKHLGVSSWHVVR